MFEKNYANNSVRNRTEAGRFPSVRFLTAGTSLVSGYKSEKREKTEDNAALLVYLLMQVIILNNKSKYFVLSYWGLNMAKKKAKSQSVGFHDNR